MEQKAINDKVIVRYLLGELSEDEQAKIEEQYFVDDGYFELLVAIEDELIDGYVTGELSARERERFEKYFLNSPQRRQRLEFAKTLMKVVAETAPVEQTARTMVYTESRPWWQSLLNFFVAPNPALSFAVLLGFVIGSSWLLIKNTELRNRLAKFENLSRAQLAAITDSSEKLQSKQELIQQLARNERQLIKQLEHEKAMRAHLEQEVNSLKSSQVVVDSFMLFADATRSAGAGNQVAIKQGIDFVELKLVLGNTSEYKSYHATIQNADEEIIASQGLLPAHLTKSEKMITWRLSAAYFPEDEYLLILDGMTGAGKFELVDSYKFSVRKK